VTKRRVHYRKVPIFPGITERKVGRCGCMVTARGKLPWRAFEMFYLSQAPSCRRRVAAQMAEQA
jgi:hypothetical protein